MVNDPLYNHVVFGPEKGKGGRIGKSDEKLIEVNTIILCHLKQRSYQRWLDKRIYKTEMKFWAVLGSGGCREKNLPTAISMQLFGVVFSTFCGQENIFKSF